jgi:hypothetical protein
MAAFQQGEELQYSGRISQLMGCWMKAWELDKLAAKFRDSALRAIFHFIGFSEYYICTPA